jgi:mannose-6-phosphate isomerase
MALETALRRYSAWFWDEALPFWATRAQDRAGGFHESLDFTGAPNRSETRRVRVQWRQVHVFATVARLGRLAGAAEIAERGFRRALALAAPGDGVEGCAHLLGPDGAVRDARRDLYDQAFFLLACASHARAFSASAGLAIAANVRDFMERTLASPDGGFREDDFGTLPRRQNPHMHLFEAFLALHAATGAARWRDDALAVLRLLADRFLDPQADVLREFFTADFGAPDPSTGDLTEPGHMAEWVWLLDRARVIAPAAGALLPALYRRAAELGRDDQGLLVNAVRIGGAAEGRRRLWPQTEYLKASLVMVRSGDAAAAATAERLISRLFDVYLKAPVAGAWIDEFDRDGLPIATAVPASILYHLLEAALACDAFLKDQGA